MQELLAAQSAAVDDAGSSPAPAPVPSPASASVVPAPYDGGDGSLSPRELGDLAACEAALENLRVAFWAAGKALQVIRDARLYRETHGTFEDYLADRWDMSRAHAYRLISAWPLAERLSPIGDRITESQIRELLPVASEHGGDAAAAVYQAVADAGSGQVTAALLHSAVSVIPAGQFDPAGAAAQISAYLAGSAPVNSPAPPDPVSVFTTQASRMLRVMHRASDLGTLRAAAGQDSETVRKVIADLRALLDQIEQAAT